MREQWPSNSLQFIRLRKTGVHDGVVRRILMLQSVEGTRVALRDKQVHGLPVAEAEHGLILIDQLAEESEGVGVIRLIDG